MEQAYKEKGSHVYYKIGRVFLVIKKFPDLIIGFFDRWYYFFLSFSERDIEWR